MRAYGDIMVCDPAHRPMEKRVGHMEHMWVYTGESGYMGMLQPV